MSRRRDCNLAEARGRCALAAAFVDAADRLATDGCDADVVVTNAVHGGIAASDAICCAHLGERSADQDHAAAVRLLATVDKRLAGDLGRLLALKTTAAYETRRLRAADADAARRRARRLLDAARAALTAS